MRRTGMIGLCVAAALAVSAVLAGGALAAKHVNKGPLKYSSTSGLAFLEQTGGVSRVECKVSESVGEWTSATQGTITTTFHVCEALGQKCNSAGQGAGTIKTELLKTTLGWLNAGTKVAGVSFTAAGPTDLADYECPGATPIKERSKGGVIGEPTPQNVSSTGGSLKIEGVTACRKVRHAGKGKYNNSICTELGGSKEYEKGRFQEDEKFEGGLPILLESEVSENGGATYESAEGIQNIEHAAQVNTEQTYMKGSKTLHAQDPGDLSTKGSEPQMGRCRAQKHGHYTEEQCLTLAAEKNGKFKGHFEFVPIPS